MTTLMPTLIVYRPRGQRDDVFQDPCLNKGDDFYRVIQVYSYKVLPGNVLKIYAHDVRVHFGRMDLDTAGDPYEVAHFRSNQWDSVRSGRK